MLSCWWHSGCSWRWTNGFCSHSIINENDFCEGMLSMLSFAQWTSFWLKRVSNVQLNSIQPSVPGEYFPLKIPPVPPSETVPSYLHPHQRPTPTLAAWGMKRQCVFLCVCVGVCSLANIYTLTSSFIVLMLGKPGLLCQLSLGQSCYADVSEAWWWK